jgi:hypothetical protein
MTRGETSEGSGGGMIPLFLVGKYRHVRRQWGAAARRLLKGEPWAEVFSDQEYVSLDSIPFPLVVGGPLSEGLDDDEQVLLHPVFDYLTATARNNQKLLNEVRRVIHDGVEHFWFSLCLLGTGSTMHPPLEDEELERQDAIHILRHVIHWWPQMCRYDGRYLNGAAWFLDMNWPQWARPIFRLCGTAGMQAEVAESTIRSGAEPFANVLRFFLAGEG